jgi:rubrerythrin
LKAFERTRDVLEHARVFHKQLSELYHQLEGKAERERVRMLLDYLSRHEKHLDESLASYEEEASRMVLDTWFQYTPEADTSQLLAQIKLQPGMSVSDVVRVALRLDDYLVDLYRSMAEHSDIPEVREVFTNLLDMERQEKHQAARNALRLDEM